MEIYRDNTGKIYNWVVSSLNNGECYPNDLTLGIFSDNILIGGVIYSVIDKDVYLSIYTTTPKWSSRKILTVLFDIPFNIFKAKKVMCLTSVKNDRINKLLKGLGLTQERKSTDRKEKTKGLVFSITKDKLNKQRWYKI